MKDFEVFCLIPGGFCVAAFIIIVLMASHSIFGWPPSGMCDDVVDDRKCYSCRKVLTEGKEGRR